MGKKRKSKKSWLWEFSKKIVWMVTVVFVAMVIFCSVLLIFHPDSMAIPQIFDRICQVFEVTVVSYAVKAGFENVFKIRRNDYGMDSEQLGSSFDPCDGSSRADIPYQE